jgi:tetratricopeptide (TPR) repeat protein
MNVLPLVLLISFVVWLIFASRRSWLAAYRRGDYAAALQATEGLRKARTIREYWFLRGGALMQPGQLDEAEKSLNQAMELMRPSGAAIQGPRESRKRSALGSAILIELYLEQSRYDEAVKRSEASLRDLPGHGPFHAYMAEACLRRGDRPGEALKWATLAVEEDRTDKALPRESHNSNLSEHLATLAWAVAVASRDRAQVDRLVDEAVNLADALSIVPTSAQVHFKSGLAYAALGDEERCTRYFEEAARIDPQGRWGRAARAKATELSR